VNAPSIATRSTASLALAAVFAPLALVLGYEAAGVRQLGYTRSLVLFLVPVAAGAAWFLSNRCGQRAVQWRAFSHTVGSWTCIGWLLDLALAGSFFRFPDPSTACGITVPGLDFASGGVVSLGG